MMKLNSLSIQVWHPWFTAILWLFKVVEESKEYPIQANMTYWTQLKLKNPSDMTVVAFCVTDQYRSLRSSKEWIDPYRGLLLPGKTIIITWRYIKDLNGGSFPESLQVKALPVSENQINSQNIYGYMEKLDQIFTRENFDMMFVICSLRIGKSMMHDNDLMTFRYSFDNSNVELIVWCKHFSTSSEDGTLANKSDIEI